MHHTKRRKFANRHKLSAAEKDARRDEAICGLIRGLDQLSAEAEAAKMGMAMRIFYTAKEELLHWAVTMNFHETASDHFINKTLYGIQPATVSAFINRMDNIKDARIRAEVLKLFGMSAVK